MVAGEDPVTRTVSRSYPMVRQVRRPGIILVRLPVIHVFIISRGEVVRVAATDPSEAPAGYPPAIRNSSCMKRLTISGAVVKAQHGVGQSSATRHQGVAAGNNTR